MENKNSITKKWWFWVIIAILGWILLRSILGKSNSNTSQNKVNSTNVAVTKTVNEVVNKEESKEQEKVSLEDEIKQVTAMRYDFESIERDGSTLIVNLSKTGNAQYTIGPDVDYEYVQNLAPIVYKAETIQKFILKVKMIDSSKDDYFYIYGCSLTRDVYSKYDWAGVLDTDIDKIFAREGELYST